MTAAIVGVWTAVYLSPNLSAKTCYVKKSPDGKFSMINYIDDGLGNDDDITNVSSRFDHLSVSYLAQSVLSLITVSYQLVGIYCLSSLLMYRHFISRINKLFLLYGAYILVMTHIYRLDEPGKICSGDYLSAEEKKDPKVWNNYLLEVGNIFWFYLVFIWVLIALAGCVGTILGLKVYRTFA